MLSFRHFLTEWQTLIASSNLKSARYTVKTQTLRVWFRSGGVYDYENVPFPLVKRMMNAASRGRFFHKYIRFAFGYTQVTPPRKGYTNSFNTHKSSVKLGVHPDEKISQKR